MEENEADSMIRSIDICISLLQDDLSQPGSSAIFLKLVASWKRFKSSFNFPEVSELKKQNENLQMCLQKARHEQISAESLYNGQKKEIKQLSRELPAFKEEGTLLTSAKEKTFIDLTLKGGQESINDIKSAHIDQPEPIASRTLVPESEEGQEVTSEPSTIQSSATDSEVLGPAPVVSIGDGSGGGDDELGEEYEKVEFSVLYYHKTSGYYYEPRSQQFLAPYNSGEGQVGGAEVGGAEVGVSGEAQPTTQEYYSTAAATTSQPGQVGYSYDPASGSATTTTTTSQSGQVDHSYDPASGSAAVQTTSIADILAATSERAVERCGYEYNEGLDMFYDANIGLYYHQESKLYYDADLGCYYQYDFDTKTYTVHSRVKLPDQEEGEKKRKKSKEETYYYVSSDEEFKDSPEEGEIRLPHMPRGSPPPEEEWDPCIRALVSESETLQKGTLFIVTQDGANIGREPTGTNCLIKIPELKVSKLHAVLSYDKHEKSFIVQDLGSVNGTFLNKDQRLSEPRTSSTPCPLVHGHTLTMGSTTLTLHIHAGWETCVWCDPSRGAWQGTHQDAGEEGGPLEEEELDLQRRKELNRIKKKYGLRMKDTYGKDEVVVNEEYTDRSHKRRKVVGSDVPPSQRPDDTPSSVHKPIDDTNKGRKMLEKMGWKKGEGLGRENEGRAEPVKAEIRASAKTGLGTSDVTQSLDTAWDQSTSIAKSQRMRKRYDDAIKNDHSKKKRIGEKW